MEFEYIYIDCKVFMDVAIVVVAYLALKAITTIAKKK